MKDQVKILSLQMKTLKSQSSSLNFKGLPGDYLKIKTMLICFPAVIGIKLFV
jgi:hypothetical protein